MIEHNTDRLFWTLAAIIVGSLLLTICLKTFPGLEHNAMSALTNITKSANTNHPSTEQKFIGGFNPNPNDAVGTKVNPDGNPTKINVQNYVEASTLNLRVIPNGDGTGVLAGTVSGQLSGNFNIPEYVKVNGQLTKITSIGEGAFAYSQLTSITIPNSITNIGTAAFAWSHLTSVNIPNQQGYQSAQSNAAFGGPVTVTNNPS